MVQIDHQKYNNSCSIKILRKFLQITGNAFDYCKIHLELNWSKDCIIYGADTYDGGVNDNNREATFKIKNTKWYVPIVTKFDKTIK